jgi:hypothetical protein
MNKKQQIKQIEKNEIKKSISTNSYKYLINFKNQYQKPYYNNFDIFEILKTLYKLNKISKNQYRESIKRLNTNRKLKTKINEIIHYYLSTFKAHKTKNTISALKRQNHKRFILLKCNKWVTNQSGLIYPINSTFKVFLKKSAYINLYDIDINQITREFKIQQNNKQKKYFGGGIKY